MIGNQEPRIDIYLPGNTDKAELLFQLLDEYGTKLFDWQKHVLRRWLAEDENGNFVNLTCGLSVPRQNGKDLSENTQIPTPKGWKKMVDIRVGDYIFGDDGKLTKVLAKYEPEEKNFYEIDFGNAGKFINETIRAGGGHLWELSTGDWTHSKVLDTNWIYDNFKRIKAHKQNLKVKLTQPVDYPEQSLPLDPYCLGLWLGDGASRSGNVSCHISDAPIYIHAFSKVGAIKEVDEKTNRGFLFNVKGLRRILTRMKLINNKHIPEIYLRSSIEQRYELLRGLMDSDGHAEKHSSEVSWSQSGRPEFVNQFMELVCSLGMKPSYRVKELSKKNPNHKDAYEVKFNVVGDKPIFKSKRRLAQFNEYNTKPQLFNYWYIKDIRKIEKKPDEHYYCLSVDNESHLFLCGKSYIPTHNSELLVARIIYGIIFRRAQGLYTAQKMDTALEILRRVKDFFYENPHEEIFNLLTPKFRQKLDYEYIEFQNGARYSFKTRTRMGGLGHTLDEVLNDEASDMQDTHEETLRPTVSASKLKNPQFIYAGTPPMVESVGEVFQRTRTRILKGEKGAWTEWGVEILSDPHDKKAWYQANPSLGLTLLETAVEAEATSLSVDGFNRMRLGWWAGLEHKRAIPQKMWDACYTEKPDFDETVSPVYAVKFAPDRSYWSLAAAMPLKDGKIHVEIVNQRPMSDGFSKLTKWLTERWQKCSRIIIDGATGQSILFEDLTSQGVFKKKIIIPHMKEIVAAHEFTWNAIQHQEFSHYNQPLLNQTVRLAKMRDMGRYGGFGWESMSKDLPSVALDAATFAYWGQKVFGEKLEVENDVENEEKWKNILSHL